MQVLLLIMLIIAVLLSVFSLQNAVLVNVNLWFWDVESSLAMITLISITLGIFIGLILAIPMIRKRGKKIKQLQSELRDLDDHKNDS